MTTTTRALLAALAATAVLSGTAGCTSDDSEPKAAAPGDAARVEPLTFPDAPGEQGFSCVQVAGDLLFFDLVRVSSPVTLDGATFADATGVDVHHAWITPKPVPGTVHVGMVRGSAPPRKFRDDVAWARRTPLAGAQLDPGSYYFFLDFEVTTPADTGGVDLAWSSADGSGTGHFVEDTRFRGHCA